MTKELIDDEFYVDHRKWGTYQSFDKEGKGLITSLTEEECIRATRWYLKFKQEKQYEQNTTTYSGSVDYKL
jgi:hypothetical protein